MLMIGVAGLAVITALRLPKRSQPAAEPAPAAAVGARDAGAA